MKKLLFLFLFIISGMPISRSQEPIKTLKLDNDPVGYSVIYHPFYNGIQMVEIRFGLTLNSIADYRPTNFEIQRPMPKPDPVVYLFRDTAGTIIKSFNLLGKSSAEFELTAPRLLKKSELKGHQTARYVIIKSGKNSKKLSSVKWANADLTGGKYGLIDSLGNIILNTDYQFIGQFTENNLFQAKRNGKYGIIDLNGKIVCPFIYSEMECWSAGEGYAFAVSETGRTYINSRGKVINVRKYDSGEMFWSRRAVVCVGNKYGYIDTTGREICPIMYDYASNFYRTIAIVKLGEKFGLIDNTGVLAVPLEYDSIMDTTDEERTPMPSGYIAKKNGETFYFDLAGKLVNP